MRNVKSATKCITNFHCDDISHIPVSITEVGDPMNTIKVHRSIGMRGSWEKFGNQWGFTIDIREATLFICERLLYSIDSDDDGEIIDVIVLFCVGSNAREHCWCCTFGGDNAGVGTDEDLVVGC